VNSRSIRECLCDQAWWRTNAFEFLPSWFDPREESVGIQLARAVTNERSVIDPMLVAGLHVGERIRFWRRAIVDLARKTRVN